MVLVSWILVIGWLGLFLASARHTLKPLPDPGIDTPPYVLWLPEGGEAPNLEPAPIRVHTSPEPPSESSFILCLGRDISVPVDLPARLSASSSDFVSVLPHPKGMWASAARERMLRDVAGPQNVNDVLHPAGYADARCAWFHRADVERPGWGSNVVAQIARARKFHGLPVDLRAGRATRTTESSVRMTKPLSTDEFRARLSDFLVAEPILGPVIGTLLITLNVGPWLGLF